MYITITTHIVKSSRVKAAVPFVLSDVTFKNLTILCSTPRGYLELPADVL